MKHSLPLALCLVFASSVPAAAVCDQAKLEDATAIAIGPEGPLPSLFKAAGCDTEYGSLLTMPVDPRVAALFEQGGALAHLNERSFFNDLILNQQGEIKWFSVVLPKGTIAWLDIADVLSPTITADLLAGRLERADYTFATVLEEQSAIAEAGAVRMTDTYSVALGLNPFPQFEAVRFSSTPAGARIMFETEEIGETEAELWVDLAKLSGVALVLDGYQTCTFEAGEYHRSSRADRPHSFLCSLQAAP